MESSLPAWRQLRHLVPRCKVAWMVTGLGSGIKPNYRGSSQKPFMNEFESSMFMDAINRLLRLTFRIDRLLPTLSSKHAGEISDCISRMPRCSWTLIDTVRLKSVHPFVINPTFDSFLTTFEPVLQDRDRKRLEDFKKHIDRANLLLEFAQYEKMQPLYEKRRALTKSIPKFWPVALMRHPAIAMELEKEEDQEAIQYLKDISVRRDPVEPRAYTIEFEFMSNPFFENKVLRKKFRFTESNERKAERADMDGFKWSMLDFDWEDDVKPQPCRIKWKRGMNLCQLHPMDEEDGEVVDLGSFFNWFQADGDPFDVGVLIAEDIFTDAIDYFTGDDDSEDNGEDDAEEYGEDDAEEYGEDDAEDYGGDDGEDDDSDA